jgi:hypothetical protein
LQGETEPSARPQGTRNERWHPGEVAAQDAIDVRPIPWCLVPQERSDARIARKKVRAPPEVQHRLVEHATNLLRRIGNALSRGDEHRALDLLVAEAGEYGHDDEDKRGNE